MKRLAAILLLTLAATPSYAPDGHVGDAGDGICWRTIMAAMANTAPSGFGDLTVGEVLDIQLTVDMFGYTSRDFQMWVVGSAASGRRRRNSDIDYLIERKHYGGRDEDIEEGLATTWAIGHEDNVRLPGRDEYGFGLWIGTPDLTRGPAILFRPRQIPVLLPQTPG